MTTAATMSRESAAGESIPRLARAAGEFHYTQHEDFVAVLHELGASLVITICQANKLLVARVAGAGLSTLVRAFDRPMGLASSGDRLALGCREQIWEFRSAPDIAPQVEPDGQHDVCFVPCSSHVTGDVGVHKQPANSWLPSKLLQVLGPATPHCERAAKDAAIKLMRAKLSIACLVAAQVRNL